MKRKYQWVDEYAKRTGEEAMKDAVENGTYIVYESVDGKLVKGYPDGTVIPLYESNNKEINDGADNRSTE